MKKRFFILSVVLTLGLGILSLPGFLISNILIIDAAALSAVTDYETVHAGGVIEEENSVPVTVKYPVIAGQIFVSEGDRVEKDQLLATVDKNATQLAILSLGSDLLGLPSGITSLLSDANLDLFAKALPESIVAPESGIIRSLSVGYTLSNPQLPLAVIAADDRKFAKVFISETQITKIREGLPAKITGSGFEGTIYGTVEKIADSAVKKQAGTSQETVIEVSISLEKAQSYLVKTGLSVNAEILTETPAEIRILPYDCISQDENMNEFIYVIEKGKLIKTYIKTGKENPDGMEIISGIPAGALAAKDIESISNPAQKVLVRRSN